MTDDILTIHLNDITGDTFEVRVRATSCHLEIDSPWAGSTEEGFGQTLGCSLTPAQALQVGQMLVAWAKARTK